MVDQGKFVLPPVEQVALIVKNLEKTAEYLSSSLGIGPFRISERHGLTEVYGEPTLARRKLGIARMGGLDLELIQGLEVGTPYYDFINSKGEVLQHIRFAPVEDLDQTVTYLEEKGFKVVYSGGHEGRRFAYLESENAKGLILEFVQ
jgi:hypothetical protein